MIVRPGASAKFRAGAEKDPIRIEFDITEMEGATGEYKWSATAETGLKIELKVGTKGGTGGSLPEPVKFATETSQRVGIFFDWTYQRVGKAYVVTFIVSTKATDPAPVVITPEVVRA